LGVDRQIVHIEVAAARFFVGIEIPARETECLARAIIDSLIKDVVRVFLDGQGWVFEKGKVFDLGGVVQIDEDTGLFPFLGFEDGLEKANEIERWEFVGNFE
jgi:hypothetical protein